MKERERQVIGEVIAEMRAFNKWSVFAQKIARWADALEATTEALPMSDPCSLCGAAARWQRRRNDDAA